MPLRHWVAVAAVRLVRCDMAIWIILFEWDDQPIQEEDLVAERDLLMVEGLTYEIDAEHGLPIFQQWLHYGQATS